MDAHRLTIGDPHRVQKLRCTSCPLSPLVTKIPRVSPSTRSAESLTPTTSETLEPV
jgi:hypothetical protein